MVPGVASGCGTGRVTSLLGVALTSRGTGWYQVGSPADPEKAKELLLPGDDD